MIYSLLNILALFNKNIILDLILFYQLFAKQYYFLFSY